VTGWHALRWRPAPLAVSLLTSTATVLALSLVTRRAELLGFAAPLLGARAGGWRGRWPASHVEVRAEQTAERCFEDEQVRLRVTARAVGACDEVRLRPMPPAGLERVPGQEWVLRAARWGRYAVPVEITARAGGGLLVASVVPDAVEVRVYPRPAPLRATARPAGLPDRMGVHLERLRGEGVEFAGIRPYLPGDPLDRVNWPVTARRGRLYVTERLAERACDVVVLIDTSPAGDSLDLAVHGAAEVVQAALRRGDRAGVLALGGRTRWLGPDLGRRQFYRIIDAVLDATGQNPGGEPAGSVRLPRAALPPHACVIAFTSLLDAGIGLALREIRGRGHGILVVDVLREPPGAERLWRSQRQGLHQELATAGIPVVPWTENLVLDQVLHTPARRPLPNGRPPR
jgi:uncharacterized protein (DUF58 family)